MVKSQTSRRSRRPSTLELHSKLSRIFSRHEQMKVAFHQLESQIKIGLLEAEDVFESLAVPLMRLVGLKTAEWAKESRFSTIVTNTNSNTRVESYTIKATMARQELLQKQRLQLTQLVHILRKIESQVNSSQDDILQNLADHQASMQKFFRTGIAYITAIHQTGQSNGTFIAALKLFKATFDRMNTALGSVERGVEDMMHQLAEQMCYPMVEYVKGLKAEMASGPCPRLLAIVEEMGGAMKNGEMELEEARKKVKVAEERNLEALRRLKELEERTTRMKEYLGYILEAQKEHNVTGQFSGMEKDRAEDDQRLLWEQLKMKRKLKQPHSPIGPQELLFNGLNNNHLKTTRVTPPVSSRPITRNYLRGITPQTPSLQYHLPLGSSPAVATRQVSSHKRISP